MQKRCRRAVSKELVSHLLAAWGECTPSVVEFAESNVVLEAMQAALQCLRLVLQQISGGPQHSKGQDFTKSAGKVQSCDRGLTVSSGPMLRSCVFAWKI